MTIKDIVQLTGAPISTVFRIMNNKDRSINPEIRSRVLKVVKDYNYVPYGSVKNTSGARTFILGILPHYISKTNLFLSGVTSAIQAGGYNVVVYGNNGDMEYELRNITSLCKNYVDGITWEPVCEQSLECRRYFDEQNIEICLMSAAEKQPCYLIDFKEVGYQATQVPFDYHHRKLGCLTRENNQRSRMVLEGFYKCLFDNNIPSSEDIKLPAGGSRWYSRILFHVPTGIVSSHYTSSMILMEQLGKFKSKVPYDLSLVSLRDDARENIQFPGISSTKTSYYKFGDLVCGRLIRQYEKQEMPDEPLRVEYPLENAFNPGAPFSSCTKRIVAVGSINIDMTLNVNGLPQPGKTISTSKHPVIPGGKRANQSVGVTKLGNEVALVGQVGNDYDSTLVYICMEEHRVDTQGIRRDIRAETGKAHIHVQNGGESMITILTGASQSPSPTDVNHYEDLSEHSEYRPPQTEVLEAAVFEAARQARKYGVKNILKLAVINQINHSLMQYIDVSVPSWKGAEILCSKKSDIESKAEAFQAMGARTITITLGHHGCYIKDNSFCSYLPAADFIPADTIGAVDAPIVTLAVYLLNGHSLVSAIKIATYATGFYVSRRGAIPTMIDRNSPETYIARKELELMNTHSCLV